MWYQRMEKRGIGNVLRRTEQTGTKSWCLAFAKYSISDEKEKMLTALQLQALPHATLRWVLKTFSFKICKEVQGKNYVYQVGTLRVEL